MRRSVLRLLAAALLLVSGTAVQAGIILGFDPAFQKVVAGDAVDVDLVISGLGNNTAPSLGAFDLTVEVDPLVLDFTGLTFGDPVLGDQLDLFGFGSISGVATPTTGEVDLFEISLDAPSDLDTLQVGSFVLATLSFTALSNGISSLDYAAAVLSDSLGNALTAELTSGAVKVPEPATLTLLAAGFTALLGFVGSSRRRKGVS